MNILNIENLTLDEAKTLHRKMWEYIRSTESGVVSDMARMVMKKKFCIDSGVYPYPINWCFLCEYVSQHYGGDCNKCPALWGSEESQSNFFCEPRGPKGLDWTSSKAEDIRDIKFKEDCEYD